MKDNREMNTRKALVEAIKQSDLLPRQKMTLRLALVFRGKEIDKIVDETVLAEGMRSVGPDVSAGEWAAIVKFFIEVILPLLLKLMEQEDT